MTKRIKLIMILLSVVLVAFVATGVGLTAAIWTSSTPGSGNTVAPATESPINWNVWAKYFTGVVLNENLHTVAITNFHTDDAGLNLETVIIPEAITIDGKEYKVVEITNQVFADATLKSGVVNLYIPSTVTRIEAMSFANLQNLSKVVFGANKDSADPCVVEDFAFMMDTGLTNVITNGRTLNDTSGAALTKSSSAFMGCSDSLAISETV